MDHVKRLTWLTGALRQACLPICFAALPVTPVGAARILVHLHSVWAGAERTLRL